MNLYEIKKVENCISKSAVYQYRFSFKIDEDFINRFGSSAEIKVHKNFPKPSFNIAFTDGTKVIGVFRDVAFKVMYPLESTEECKDRFETILAEITGSPEQGRDL